MTKQEMIHYVQQIVLHEADSTSTNDRIAYWAAVAQQRNTVPRILPSFEHG
jgi:hypothetical protein